MAVDPVLTTAFVLLQQDTEDSRQELWNLFSAQRNAPPPLVQKAPSVPSLPALQKIEAPPPSGQSKPGRALKRKAVIVDDESDDDFEDSSVCSSEIQCCASHLVA
jgi:hypothetical protein